MKKRNFLVVVLIVLLLATVMVLAGCGPECKQACGGDNVSSCCTNGIACKSDNHCGCVDGWFK